MRPLFVCPDMTTGGAQRHWAILIRALAERNVRAALLTLAEEGPLFEEVRSAGVPALCARMSRRTDRAGLLRALTFAKGHRPDVIVTRGVSAQLMGVALARRARAPHVMNEHTPCLPDGSFLPMRPHQRLLTRLVAGRVDRVIAVTGSQVPPLVELGYRPDRIEVVPNGVFAERLRPSLPRPAARAELGLGEKDFAALLVAALRPEKRVDAFVAAVVGAHRSDPRVRGLVAGSGRELERLRPLALGSNGSVRLLGERGDVPDLLAAADAVCLASEAEALPMVLLEAMALGRPVIATTVGGAREAVVPGETGFLVDPGDERALADALLALAADSSTARRLGEAGRKRQRERFDGERMVEGYLRAIEGVSR
jgi:glycosyltransferase involved in cell wall biosynthesis